jgi:hypothetical protein
MGASEMTLTSKSPCKHRRTMSSGEERADKAQERKEKVKREKVS